MTEQISSFYSDVIKEKLHTYIYMVSYINSDALFCIPYLGWEFSLIEGSKITMCIPAILIPHLHLICHKP
jgi:hypothetical protein